MPELRFLAFDRVFAREPVFELGRHPWPDRRTVAAHLLGVLGPAGNAHHRVIFYDDGGMNFAARAALCARWAGFKNAQILDGGLSAWVRCGLPLNDGAPAAADHPAAERVNEFSAANDRWRRSSDSWQSGVFQCCQAG